MKKHVLTTVALVGSDPMHRIFRGLLAVSLVVALPIVTALIIMSVGLLFGASPAHATTYDYVGDPIAITSCNQPPSLCFPGGSTSVTASVTFDFHTSNFSGTLDQTSLSSATVTSGLLGPPPGGFCYGTSFCEFNPLLNPDAAFSASLTLASGAITSWTIAGFWKPGPGPDSAQTSTSSSGDATSLSTDTFLEFGSTNAPGLWSPPSGAATPLPAALPLFATGLGALGLLGWRRKRKSRAEVA
jgi:hypothetical protein